jgi:two-component sensor histidine kinase
LEAFSSDRISMEGPEIFVPALIVQPLALVLHELLVNAAVHGSLSGPSGKLKICWQEVTGKCGFKIQWQESGGPSPNRDHRPGFGTAMVAAMIETQLLGHVERDWTDDGLVVDITVPSPDR